MDNLSENSLDTTASAVRYCTLCQKPFTIESSYKRHVSYCRRVQNRPRKRQKSCRACSQAKAKCTFQIPCTRCVIRNVQCIYDQRGVKPASEQLAIGPPSLDAVVENLSSSATELDNMFFDTDLSWLTELPVETPKAMPQEPTPIESVQNSPKFRHVDILPQLQSYFKVNPRDSNISMRGELGTLSPVPIGNPLAKQSACLILQHLRTFPEKMLNQNDLPFFIHSHSHRDGLPEPLAVCTRICQMFNTRTPDILPFIFRCIRAEQQRHIQENLAPEDLLAACQAQIIYIMMLIIESGMQRKEWVQEMLVLCGAICVRLIVLCNEQFCQDEQSSPSMTWEDWVFAESRRRTACVWFLMSQVFSLQTGRHCDTIDNFRMLPLPSSKLQWEASSYDVWEQRSNPQFAFDEVHTIGHLLDMHQRGEEPLSAQKLDSWNAKTDHLGTLLNVATALV